MEGTRKFRAWFIAMLINSATFASPMFFGIAYTPESITTIILINSTLTGAFFGANFGEHWSKTKLNGIEKST